MGGPLDGLRVVDVTTTLTGAHISQTLADFGADVVQVEPPGGSPLRRQAGLAVLGSGQAQRRPRPRRRRRPRRGAGPRGGCRRLRRDLATGRRRAARSRRRGAAIAQPAAGVRVGHGLRSRQPVVAAEGLRTGRVGEDRRTARVLRPVRPAGTVVRRRAVLHLHREPARTARHPRRAVRARDERPRSAGRHHLGAGDPRPRHVELADHGDHRQVRRRVHRRTARGAGPA